LKRTQAKLSGASSSEADTKADTCVKVAKTITTDAATQACEVSPKKKRGRPRKPIQHRDASCQMLGDGGKAKQDGGKAKQDGGKTQQDSGKTHQNGGKTQQDFGTWRAGSSIEPLKKQQPSRELVKSGQKAGGQDADAPSVDRNEHLGSDADCDNDTEDDGAYDGQYSRASRENMQSSDKVVAEAKVQQQKTRRDDAAKQLNYHTVTKLPTSIFTSGKSAAPKEASAAVAGKISGQKASTHVAAKEAAQKGAKRVRDKSAQDGHSENKRRKAITGSARRRISEEAKRRAVQGMRSIKDLFMAYVSMEQADREPAVTDGIQMNMDAAKSSQKPQSKGDAEISCAHAAESRSQHSETPDNKDSNAQTTEEKGADTAEKVTPASCMQEHGHDHDGSHGAQQSGVPAEDATAFDEPAKVSCANIGHHTQHAAVALPPVNGESVTQETTDDVPGTLAVEQAANSEAVTASSPPHKDEDPHAVSIELGACANQGEASCTNICPQDQTCVDGIDEGVKSQRLALPDEAIAQRLVQLSAKTSDPSGQKLALPNVDIAAFGDVANHRRITPATCKKGGQRDDQALDDTSTCGEIDTKKADAHLSAGSCGHFHLDSLSKCAAGVLVKRQDQGDGFDQEDATEDCRSYAHSWANSDDGLDWNEDDEGDHVFSRTTCKEDTEVHMLHNDGKLFEWQRNSGKPDYGHMLVGKALRYVNIMYVYICIYTL
jgi:hypothetical protein